jgi:hypothetical protein
MVTIVAITTTAVRHVGFHFLGAFGVLAGILVCEFIDQCWFVG